MEKAWHSMSIEEAMREVSSSIKGLGSSEAKERLLKYGLNDIEIKPSKTVLKIFLGQFKSILITALLVSALLSALLNRIYESIAIVAIVGIAAILGFIQEYKSERTLEALKRQTPSYTKVIRDGQVVKVRTIELVPGDIVLFEAGDRIPADLRLIESHSLVVDEAILTGESVPVAKDANTVLAPNTPIYERANMVFMGTYAVGGRGVGLVVATGLSTELGKIAKLVKRVEEETEIHRAIEKLGHKLVSLFAILCAVFFVYGFMTGGSLVDMLIAAIALAVAAIPEGLPAAVTMALALGVRRMASRNVIVRKLGAIQSMGSLTVVCTDKTGTLTKNQMTIRSIWLQDTGLTRALDGQATTSSNLLLTISALCHSSSFVGDKWSGDPTDLALIDLAERSNVNVRLLMAKCVRLGEIPFDPKLKLMAIACKLGPQVLLMVKGAPEAVIEKCSSVLANNESMPLDSRLKQEVINVYQMMASRGERVLALAYKELPGRTENLKLQVDDLKDLVLVGLVGLVDPPREGVREAVKACHDAGIKIIMLTGDSPITACAIANELGIASGKTDKVLGEDLRELPLNEVARKLGSACAVARAMPEDKLRIVQALKKLGEVVAMTGDGVNDAPALKMADVGVSMGLRGSDVAREASHIILTDDNFASLVAGIMEGRTITENIRKIVTYLLMTSFSILLLVFTSSVLFGADNMALNALQILMLNVVIHGLPALTISFDEPSRDIMKLHPKHFSSIVTWRSVMASLMYGGALSTILLLTYIHLLLRHNIELASTTIYVAISTMLLASLYLIRIVYRSSALRNRWIHVAVASSILLQLLTVYYDPLRVVFKCTPLTFDAWVIVALLTMIPVTASIIVGFALKYLK
ncbi:MAG: cation-transporting P-type ATPase [Candidatus Nezhaarchaeota archaeon]|nr:cation-transporting P-type ATPase [Candidatus Nezhaarchaeota archaeon]